jgi:hypothetical protein
MPRLLCNLHIAPAMSRDEPNHDPTRTPISNPMLVFAIIHTERQLVPLSQSPASRVVKLFSHRP